MVSLRSSSDVSNCASTCRFTDVSGKLDERIFSKNYSFLDEYRESEIEVLAKAVKKIKNPSKKEEVKAELLRYCAALRSYCLVYKHACIIITPACLYS